MDVQGGREANRICLIKNGSEKMRIIFLSFYGTRLLEKYFFLPNLLIIGAFLFFVFKFMVTNIEKKRTLQL